GWGAGEKFARPAITAYPDQFSGPDFFSSKSQNRFDWERLGVRIYVVSETTEPKERKGVRAMYRGTRTQVGDTISALYDRYCRASGKWYRAGDSIRKVATKTWHHATCPDHSTPTAAPRSAAPTVPPASANGAPSQVSDEHIADVVRKELEGATLA